MSSRECCESIYYLVRCTPYCRELKGLYRAEMIVGDDVGDKHVSLCYRYHLRSALLPMLQAELVEHIVVEYPI